MLKKFLAVAVSLVAGVLALAGCSKNKLDGTWVLSEMSVDGQKYSREELLAEGFTEKYVISGNNVEYTTVVEETKEQATAHFTLEHYKDNKYQFRFDNGEFVFVTVEVNGDTMTYEVYDGFTTKDMVFVRE